MVITAKSKNRLIMILKRVGVVNKINAIIKTFRIKQQYRNIVKYYSEKELSHSLEGLLDSKGFTNEWSEKFKTQKPRILYVGGNVFQDKSGFLQALNKFADVIEYTKHDGSYGQYSKAVKESGLLNANRIKEILDSNDVDILMMQIWADNLDVNEISKFKKAKGFKVINISMDDRHSYDRLRIINQGTKGLIPILDLALTTSPEAVEWYMKEGVPSIFFPEASSSDFFFPMNVEKKFDVGFVGGRYGIREVIVNELQKHGINVMCYGAGWPNGRLPLAKTNVFFNECKIILGVGTIGHSNNFFALKLRDFDAPLSGSCYVTHDNKDLHLLYEPDKEIVLCKNTRDYVANIKKLLSNDSLLNGIAIKGHEKATKTCTYEARFRSLFQRLKIFDD